METVSVHDAKTHLSALLARVEQGERFVIGRAGRPAALLVPVGGPPPREFGQMDFEVPDDFDADLPADERAAWD